MESDKYDQTGQPEDDLTCRIRSAVSQSLLRSSVNSRPHLYTDFTLATSPSSQGLTLLRQAHARRQAFLISASSTHETYSISIGRVEAAKPFNFSYEDPQWWMGMSKAEMKAGPGADDKKIRDAKRLIDRKESRRKKRFSAERWNLEVGLMIQGKENTEINTSDEDERMSEKSVVDDGAVVGGTQMMISL
ncbi:hypothetical protein CC78DRAFT_542845 [Lojkania enalia]|uniref:Uncharacterized protein n=1 Tax=Lojkania enalia TaxID=147567 RepID=A0A9P4KBY3_9PLEO|nr:hypothetical protein CC78DRAFT_542845 [Didymosphaeria enalia]